MRHDAHAYDELMHGPRHVSKDRPHMSNYDRAAQFAPFAALTGFDGEIEETARLTSGRPLLDEDEKHLIDVCLRNIKANISSSPKARIDYFAADKLKEGGAIFSHRGNIAVIDEYARAVIFDDGTSIKIDDIIEAELV